MQLGRSWVLVGTRLVPGSFRRAAKRKRRVLCKGRCEVGRKGVCNGRCKRDCKEGCKGACKEDRKGACKQGNKWDRKVQALWLALHRRPHWHHFSDRSGVGPPSWLRKATAPP